MMSPDASEERISTLIPPEVTVSPELSVPTRPPLLADFLIFGVLKTKFAAPSLPRILTSEECLAKRAK